MLQFFTVAGIAHLACAGAHIYFAFTSWRRASWWAEQPPMLGWDSSEDVRRNMRSVFFNAFLIAFNLGMVALYLWRINHP